MSRALARPVVPYHGQLVRRLLMRMPDAVLATAQPAMFQMHPAEIVESGKTLSELIANERARRSK